MSKSARLSIVALTLILGAGSASAAQTRRWISDTAEELLKGRGDGVAVTTDGRLEGVPGWASVAQLEEPVVLAGGLDRNGDLIVGTGHPANLYRVTAAGAELLTAVPGEQVTAVLGTDDGVLVATVAPGVLYRWRDGRLSEVGRLGEGGVWDLALFDGTVVAAAGAPAGLYRLGKRGFERWMEIPDVHARCLEVAGGRLLVGTSGKGLILGVDDNGRMSLLADSPFTEISDMVASDDGTVWAVALVGEPVDSASAKSNDKNDNGDSGASVTTEGASLDLDLPKVNGGTATSELLRLTPEGALLSVHRFPKQVASAVAFDGEGVLVGTGFEGEIWRFVGSGGARVASIDAVQVVGIVAGGEIVLAQGPAAVLRRRTGDTTRGRFRSEAVRFARPMRFGEVRVWSDADGPRIRFRTGAAEKPDDSWLPWGEWMPAAAGRVGLPPARSLQWELELPSGVAVDRVEIAMAEINLPPTVSSVTVEEPGVVYLVAPVPSGPVIEAEHPDISGIFTVIDEKANRSAKNAKGKKYYRVGYRTVGWKAEDPNEDALRFDVEIERRDGGGRMPVRKRIDGTQLAVDTTALPDGTYRFVVTASDAAQNPGSELLTTARSRWFTIDNTPPEIEIRAEGGNWLVRVRDTSSAVAQVEWSRNGDRWHHLAPADGVLDGVDEEFSFSRGEGGNLVVVRAIDRQHNRATAGVVER